MILNEATRGFIRRHAEDDVRRLALQGAKDAEVDLPMALQQIAGRQTARRKLPTWAEREELRYPPHLNMEQCSSEQTARYKQQLVERLRTAAGGQGGEATNGTGSADCPKGHHDADEMERFVDLTGGMGVDFYWMSQGFGERIYVEQSAELCALAEHNMQVLGHDCQVCCCEAATFLEQMAPADTVYLDPARRDAHGGRTYSMTDCTPNVLELLPTLREKARRVVVKLSPMLDWRKAVGDVGDVAEVHIVSVAGECKELLLVLTGEAGQALTVHCVNDDSCFRFSPEAGESFSRGWRNLLQGVEKVSPTGGVNAGNYLYEPNASVMKAGCFGEVERRYGARQLSANSHLFTSAVEIADFPGRRFQICAISSVNRRDVAAALEGAGRANVAVRNFPMTADALRQKLRLRDGGDRYLFATTLADGSRRALICRRIG